MPKPKKRWDTEAIVSVIQQLRKQNVDLNTVSIRRTHLALYNAAIYYCGSWRQAVEAAGISYDEIKKKTVSKGKKRRWSKKAVVEGIIQCAARGESIKGGTVIVRDPGLYNAARFYFGKNGWAKARVEAGFLAYDPRPNLKWTSKTVCEEILRLHRGGTPLNHGFMLRTPKYGYIRWAAQNVFGSWKAALEAAGFNYEDIRIQAEPKWTRESILEAIQVLEGDGVKLSSKATQKLHGGLFAAALREFGNWSKAVEAAGIPYVEHCRIWSTKAWLRSMSAHDIEEITRPDKDRAT